MNTEKDTNDIALAEADHAPRKLTFSENAILTIKVFGVAGLIGAALWGLNELASK